MLPRRLGPKAVGPTFFSPPNPGVQYAAQAAPAPAASAYGAPAPNLPMRFRFQELHSFEDAQANFEQIQSRFQIPALASAPSNPLLGPNVYIDTTLGKLGYWNGSGWTYV